MIIKVVPSVMDLKFGCEVKGFSTALGRTFLLEMFDDPDELWGRMSVYPENWKDYRSEPVYTASWKKPSKKDFEIIGRPITLATVIHALDQVLTEEKIKEVMQLTKYNAMTLISNLVHLWNCADDDFDHQSEAVWEFLYGLLG